MWKKIENTKDYFVNEKGEVKSTAKKREKILKPYFNKNNKCLMVNIYFIDGSHRFMTVHRLVAETFLPNPNNYPQINHKDENRKNNDVSNLEWCSAKYNSNYGTGNARRNIQISKPVYKLDEHGNVLGYYQSTNIAGKENGTTSGSVSRACRLGGNTKAGGYRWAFVNG